MWRRRIGMRTGAALVGLLSLVVAVPAAAAAFWFAAGSRLASTPWPEGTYVVVRAHDAGVERALRLEHETLRFGVGHEVSWTVDCNSVAARGSNRRRTAAAG